MKHALARPPIVRLPPKSNFEKMLATAAQLSLVFAGLIGIIVVLEFGQFVLAPVFLAVIIGLMFGPVATRLEHAGVPPAVSAVMVVVVFILFLGAAFTLFALPLSTWVDKLPTIWAKLKTEMLNWQDMISSVKALQEELNNLTGSDTQMKVAVEDDGAVMSAAAFAPTVLAQILIFLASLYFFIATRAQVRMAVLSICVSRRLRWRVAHVFRDVEIMVSRYLLSITIINLGLGIVVSIAFMALGVPSPILWGMLAGALNYIVYIGPFVMVLIMLAVGLASFSGLAAIIAPAAVYLFINFLEAQFVTPTVLGRRLTLNPFIVFLGLTFWLWIWGPVGGFVAVPALLITNALIKNILPSRDYRTLE